jgi:hypothetical protein
MNEFIGSRFKNKGYKLIDPGIRILHIALHPRLGHTAIKHDFEHECSLLLIQFPDLVEPLHGFVFEVDLHGQVGNFFVGGRHLVDQALHPVQGPH